MRNAAADGWDRAFIERKAIAQLCPFSAASCSRRLATLAHFVVELAS
jgi:hypothetical protein